MNERFAIYFTPARDDGLTTAAESWLGRSAWKGNKVERAAFTDLGSNELEELTAAPARYGFHATLKPPMRLRTEFKGEALVDAVSGFAEKNTAAVINELVLRWIGPFLALVPAKQSEALTDFAADVVRGFEGFRAPLNDSETEKRRKSGLAPRQEEMLAKWGYPYVMEEFRFHMTLTGPVEKAKRDTIEMVARDHFSNWIGRPLLVDRLTIFHEAEAGMPFTAIGSYALARARNEKDNFKEAARS